MVKTMHAAFVKELGPVDNIIYGELPIPDITDNQVLVKTEAVAVNPVDLMIRSGKYKHIKVPLPFIVGRDFVGTVDKVGKNVHQFKSGQKVWGVNQGIAGKQGTFAEFLAIDESSVYPLPDNVDPTQAVAAVSSAIATVVGLVRAAELREGDVIYVNGAGGNVGSSIVSIAKARGAEVIASTSGKEKVDWVKQLGAKYVIDYKNEDLDKKLNEYAPQGVNVFWDTSRSPNFDFFVAHTIKRGRIVLMSGPDARPEFPVGPFYNKDLILTGFSVNNMSTPELRPYVEMVNLCLSQGILKPKIAKIFPLSQTKEAQKMQETDKSLWGRIIVTVNGK